MSAHTVITHAPTQGRGVSLAKQGDTPTLPMVLIMDAGTLHAWDIVAPVRVNLIKGTSTWDGWIPAGCGWCEDGPAMYRTDSPVEQGGVWTDLMCAHHALVWGRFEEAYAVVLGPGPIGRRGAYVVDGGFVETV